MILLELELDYIHQILYKTKDEENKKISRAKRLFKMRRNEHAITWRWLDEDWTIEQIFWFCIMTTRMLYWQLIKYFDWMTIENTMSRWQSIKYFDWITINKLLK